jgi:hypothetical protein
VNPVAGNGIRPRTTGQYPFFLPTGAVFFICPLERRVSLGNNWTWFTPTKTKRSEKTLTLTHAQSHVVLDGQVVGEQFSIPKILLISKISRQLAKVFINLAIYPFVNCGRSSLSLFIFQTGKTALLETFDPILNGARTVSQKIRYFVTGLACTYQQHAMQSVIVARFFCTNNFLLKSYFHDFGILYFKLAHGSPP